MAAALYVVLAWQHWTSPDERARVVGRAGARSAPADRRADDHAGAGAAHGRRAVLLDVLVERAAVGRLHGRHLRRRAAQRRPARTSATSSRSPGWSARSSSADRLAGAGVFGVRRQERRSCTALPIGAGLRRCTRSAMRLIYIAAVAGRRRGRVRAAGVQVTRAPATPGRACSPCSAGIGAGRRRAARARRRLSAAAPSPSGCCTCGPGATADRLFLSFDALAADVYWIRTIQHYGRDRKSTAPTGRFELLQPLLDLTTTLDPQFIDRVPVRRDLPGDGAAGRAGPRRPGHRAAREGTGARPRRVAVRARHRVHPLLAHRRLQRRPPTGSSGRPRCRARPTGSARSRPRRARRAATGTGARQMLQELLESPESLHSPGRRARARCSSQALDAIDALQHAVERLPRTRPGGIRPAGPDLVAARPASRHSRRPARACRSPTTPSRTRVVAVAPSRRCARCRRDSQRPRVTSPSLLVVARRLRPDDRQLPQRLHRAHSRGRVHRVAAVALPALRHADRLVRQHPGA